MSQGQEARTFPALTGVRALAAYGVYAFHYPPAAEEYGRFLNLAALQGHVGVHVFFVLSGFLITYRYSTTSRLEPRWIGRYLRNRFARIYPVYFLTVLMDLSLQHIRAFPNWFIHLTLTIGFAAPALGTVHHAWTLTCEEVFYALAPALFWCARRKLLLASAAATALAGLALWQLGVHAPGIQGWYRFDDLYRLVDRTYFGHFVEFYWGIWLALRLMREPSAQERTGALYTYGGSLAIAALLACMSTAYGTYLYDAIPHLVLPSAVCALFYGLIRERTALSAFLSTKPMIQLGKSSYAFYLLHVGPFAGVFLGRLGMGKLAFFVLVNVICLVLLKVFEEPAQRLLRSPGRVAA
jgi:peptidoglycan/LPS O-acetylase OafA/YrhL